MTTASRQARFPLHALAALMMIAGCTEPVVTTVDTGVDAGPGDTLAGDTGSDSAAGDTVTQDVGNDTGAVDVPPVDSGVPDVPAADTGTPPTDTGTPAMDVPPTDTGTPAMDVPVADTTVADVPSADAPRDTGPDLPACAAGQTRCGTSCVDLQTDASNCGACGTICHSAFSCTAGACVAPIHLTLETTGTLGAYVDQQLADAVVVRATDGTGTALSGITLAITAPPGAVATPATVMTNSTGHAAFTLRMGLAVGPYDFTVTNDLAATLTIHTTATAPPAGTIFTAVNVSHMVSGVAPTTVGVLGPGTTWTRMSWPESLAYASDGTLYFSVRNGGEYAVLALSPAGVLSLVAAYPNINGTHLALDDVNHLLYVGAFYGGGRDTVVIDLRTGAIDRVTSESADHVTLGPGGFLYLYERTVIRRMNLLTGMISDWYTSATPALGYSFAGSDAFGMAFDRTGAPFVSGLFTRGGSYSLVVRVAPDGSGTDAVVAGGGSMTSDGALATSTALSGPCTMAFDTPGNLYLAMNSENRVRRIDAVTGRITTVAGGGTGGDYGPATTASLSVPFEIAFMSGGHFAIADGMNDAIRIVW